MNIWVIGASRPQFDAATATAVVKSVAHAVVDSGHVLPHEPLMLSEWDIAESLTPELKAMIHTADVVVVVIATFVGADMVIKILDGVSDKAILWALPEPSVGVGRLQLNSLCGALMTHNALQGLSRDVPVIYGNPAARETQEEFVRHIRVASTIRVLQGTTLGIVGQRPPGYYPSDFDELQLQRVFGVQIRRFALSEAFRYATATSQNMVDHEVSLASEQLENMDQVPAKQLTQSVRAEQGLQALVLEHHLTSVCVECWPQYMTEYGGAVCWAHSQLIDKGIMAGCEADVHGTLSMILCQTLSGVSPFFGDLVHVTENDRLVFWHCGAAPLSLAGEKPRASIHPNRRVGLTVDFALKPGPVTVVRLHRTSTGGYLLMAIPGEAQNDPLYFSGNSVGVKPTSGARKVLAQLLEDGAEHHFAVGYNVFAEDIELVGQRLKIPVKVY